MRRLLSQGLTLPDTPKVLPEATAVLPHQANTVVLLLASMAVRLLRTMVDHLLVNTALLHQASTALPRRISTEDHHHRVSTEAHHNRTTVVPLPRDIRNKVLLREVTLGLAIGGEAEGCAWTQ